MKYVDLDPQMKYVDLDPKIIGIVDVGLDPKQTMDFAVLGKLCCRFIFTPETDEYMEKILKLRERDPVKRLPPLTVILHKKDFVNAAWGWDRLLPWTSDYVLFEDYFAYLEQYYEKNIKGVFESFKLEGLNIDEPSSHAHLMAAAASKCLETEQNLKGILADDARTKLADELCEKIIEVAASPPTVPAGSVVQAACFMCITEEARLMSVMCTTKAEEFPIELRQDKLEICNEIRQVALNILTTYRGPYSKQVSAAMLGMRKETSTACDELLHPNFDDREEIFDISEEIRQSLLQLLNIIQEKFPPNSPINYDPIERVRADLKKKYTEHQSNEVSTVDIAMPKTPTNGAAAAPLPQCVAVYESDTSNTNNKKKEKHGRVLRHMTVEFADT